MAPIIRTVRAKKRQNRALQGGFSLSGTLQEGLFTGSRVLNEVVLEVEFYELRNDGVLGSLLPEMVTWHIYQLCKGDSVPPKKTSVLGGR
jgi:hypothetical protein